MNSIIIEKYGNLFDLQSKIIGVYVKELERTVTINKQLLERKDWAVSGSDYHKDLRKRYWAEIKNCKAQIKLLKK